MRIRDYGRVPRWSNTSIHLYCTYDYHTNAFPPFGGFYPQVYVGQSKPRPLNFYANYMGTQPRCHDQGIAEEDGSSIGTEHFVSANIARGAFFYFLSRRITRGRVTPPEGILSLEIFE